MRRFFLAGLLVVVPIILTFLVLRFLFRTIDGLLAPLLTELIGRELPGVGLLATIVIVFLAGFFISSVFGSRLYSIGELLFIKTPLVRTVYGGAKQLMESMFLPSGKAFKQVVMVEYPRKNSWVIGFVGGELVVEGKQLISVFVPSTPTPFTGFVVNYPPEEVVPLSISVEEGVKFIVSGGIVAPERLRPAGTQPEKPAGRYS
ncbi:MAG: DUF502 domain-containing protein [candidate division Zixibacteria bacterium]|nr:DUF502 domain-containing protein [candidate division Zixibacteria bacterium]MCI0596098.1 DUF502 domain-containing protein [candidate division Zixibacteria bacterium]